jgi:hypothetical protein
MRGSQTAGHPRLFVGKHRPPKRRLVLHQRSILPTTTLTKEEYLKSANLIRIALSMSIQKSTHYLQVRLPRPFRRVRQGRLPAQVVQHLSGAQQCGAPDRRQRNSQRQLDSNNGRGSQPFGATWSLTAILNQMIPATLTSLQNQFTSGQVASLLVPHPALPPSFHHPAQRQQERFWLLTTSTPW